LIQKKTGLLRFLTSCPEGRLNQKHTFPAPGRAGLELWSTLADRPFG